MLKLIIQFFDFTVEEKNSFRRTYLNHAKFFAEFSQISMKTPIQPFSQKDYDKILHDNLSKIATLQSEILNYRYNIGMRCNSFNVAMNNEDTDCYREFFSQYTNSELSKCLTLDLPDPNANIIPYLKFNLKKYNNPETGNTDSFLLTMKKIDFTKMEENSKSVNSKAIYPDDPDESEIMRALRKGDGEQFGF